MLNISGDYFALVSVHDFYSRVVKIAHKRSVESQRENKFAIEL